MRLLIVEDEKMLSDVLTKGLELEGYAVDQSFDGEDAIFQIEVNQYDLVVLDLNLPKKDGLEVLAHIRTQQEMIKTIILSARVSIEDRVKGIEQGADDYLIKPFDFGELSVRIRNLLHREFKQIPLDIQFFNLTLQTKNKKIVTKDKELELTNKEFGIIEYLVFNRGRVISPEEIIDHVWNDEVNPFSSSLRYHISVLKKKMREVFNVEIIETVRGQGYIIEEEK
ncbi:DNA-binding response regulator, OmpR family, contains REC and winged-helix (wHTH) domain [Bacillus sp. 491mf]|uniref:response regulator transcription factor n=1 Tax=Bacillus sp. 491mf TaxID=1761755 RepID=UPI0008DFC73D|nr:response regulator transcription factor [Bacillus sp. 491mf]SFC81830.1 DNA-binding response regulator, OmpR family, contains REC and winged-helix (wHTH) domain [Bacillus sp. 491mf]